MRIVHSRVQHGVGQGSFHSASLEVMADDGRHYRFDYVYDCGALKGSAASPALKRSIDRMDLADRVGSGGRPVIDALVLSHYDRDHIIGAADNARRGPPGELEATDGPTGSALGPSLASTRNVQLGFGRHRAQPLWKLRFWNRGVSDELLAHLFEALVACDFPLAALFEPSAIDEVLDWLEDSQHRRATLQAYRDAIAQFAPAWAGEVSGQKLANFLSLGLYSGPESPAAGLPWFYEEIRARDGFPWGDSRRWYPYGRRGRHSPSGRLGWLGTGDAPLGEAGVWSDFSIHYAAELQTALTVQVPHHGAAPRHGPKFYNAGLHPEPGMNAVISVGKANTYGHPTVAVLKEVMAAGGDLQVVTEDTGVGFHEVIVFE